MTETQEKPQKIVKNGDKPEKLYQVSKTPMTAEMIYSAVKKEYPKMFTDDTELVKLIGGDLPVFETQREVLQ